MKYSIPFIVSSISLVTASPLFDKRDIQDVAPLLAAKFPEHEIPDSYIVVFKDHVKENSAIEHHTWVQELHTTSLKKRSQIPLLKAGSEWLNDAADGLKHTYNIPGGLLGYSGTFDNSVVEEIQKHPDVRCSSVFNARLMLTHSTRSHTLKKTRRFLLSQTHLWKTPLHGV